MSRSNKGIRDMVSQSRENKDRSKNGIRLAKIGEGSSSDVVTMKSGLKKKDS
jgi:hypothetical protein